MSSLKDRLKRLTGSSSVSGSGASDSSNGSMSGGSEEEAYLSPTAATNREQCSYTLEELGEDWRKLDAALVRNEWGSFIRRRRLYPVEHWHGDYRLADLHSCAEELAVFHEGCSVRAQDLLFFDTETTGLGLGAGNVPFMIGLGFWEAEGFAVEQLFIRNPAEELAMLAYLKPFMEKYPYLVSYNGRSFDWPLMLNRFVMNRMKEGIPEPKHLDFLYPSRSLWKNTLPSCRLGKVEEARLGFQRIDDVPGSMAPTLYFLYLAEKQAAVMGPVFIHNELDLLSLAGLAVLFAQTLCGEFWAGAKQAEEIYRLGLWLHKMGKTELSRQVLRELHNQPETVEVDLSKEAVLLYAPLAAHYKQIGEWQDAVELWRRSIMSAKESGTSNVPNLEPYIELSMYYEHRAKDYASALLYAEEALDWAERRKEAMEAVRRRNQRKDSRRGKGTWGEGPLRSNTKAGSDKKGGADDIEELEKRIRRIRDKMLRTASRPISGPSHNAPSQVCDGTDSLPVAALVDNGTPGGTGKERALASGKRRRKTSGLSQGSAPIHQDTLPLF